MTFGSLSNSEIQESLGMPTTPAKQTQIFRWMSPKNGGALHVTAMNPGSEKLGLKLSKDKDGGFTIEVTGADGYKRTVKVTNNLELKTSL